jgi:hypothetical protein
LRHYLRRLAIRPKPQATSAVRGDPARRAVLAVLLLAGAGAGCGGAMSAKDAAKTYPPGAAGLEEALADLDAAEARISERFGALASSAPAYGYPQHQYPQQQPTQPQGGYAQPPGPSPAPPPPPMAPLPGGADSPAPAAEPASPTPTAQAPADAGEGGDEDDAEERAEREHEERCELACRALGSMRRAAEHVCRAAGASDARCGRARERVGAAEQKVKESCDACDS